LFALYYVGLDEQDGPVADGSYGLLVIEKRLDKVYGLVNGPQFIGVYHATGQ